MVIITKKQTHARAQQDFYPTPLDLAQTIVRKYVPLHACTFLDPGCGDGVFARALRSSFNWQTGLTVSGIDTVDRQAAQYYDNFWLADFVQHSSFKTAAGKALVFDCVIGNPPYSLAEAFVRKSFQLLEYGGSILFLLKLAFLESKTRARGLFAENPPAFVHVLAQRPSFDGTGHTNDYAFAVFVWEKRRMKCSTALDWLDWR